MAIDSRCEMPAALHTLGGARQGAVPVRLLQRRFASLVGVKGKPLSSAHGD
ncbi:hypothetical protein MY5147_009502 [Beauveria neobassiana]